MPPFTNHVKNRHSLKTKAVYGCPKCDKKFQNKAGQRLHLLHQHGNQGQFKCSICDRIFNYKTTLDKHIHAVHLGFLVDRQEKSVQCLICDLKLASQRGLQDHIKKIHTHNSLKVKCPICDKVFAAQSTLKEHMKSRHQKSKESHKCHICDKVFDNKAKMKAHFKYVHLRYRKRDLTCQWGDCNKKFDEKAKLERHIMDHHIRTDPLQCDLCGLLLKTEKTLYNHKKNVHKPQDCLK